MAVHEPKRGNPVFGTSPKVHRCPPGSYNVYAAKTLSKQRQLSKHMFPVHVWPVFVRCNSTVSEIDMCMTNCAEQLLFPVLPSAVPGSL